MCLIWAWKWFLILECYLWGWKEFLGVFWGDLVARMVKFLVWRWIEVLQSKRAIVHVLKSKQRKGFQSKWWIVQGALSFTLHYCISSPLSSLPPHLQRSSRHLPSLLPFSFSSLSSSFIVYVYILAECASEKSIIILYHIKFDNIFHNEWS